MEMSLDECAERVARLLGLFPGVNVVSAVHSARHLRTFIAMSITSLQSLVRIVQICNCGANVSLDINGTAVKRTRGKPVDETEARYTLEIRDDEGRGSFTE